MRNSTTGLNRAMSKAAPAASKGMGMAGSKMPTAKPAANKPAATRPATTTTRGYSGSPAPTKRTAR